ncbi:MAG: hypothetical protein AB7O97_17415 [Planctomycetota bacterium]
MPQHLAKKPMTEHDAPAASDRSPTDADRVVLPLVIRPAALRLEDVEQRLRHDAAFARELVERPHFCATLARALLQRDREARQRFVDVATLALHLRAVRAG